MEDIFGLCVTVFGVLSVLGLTVLGPRLTQSTAKPKPKEKQPDINLG